jgi:hypothetical protein
VQACCRYRAIIPELRNTAHNLKRDRPASFDDRVAGPLPGAGKIRLFAYYDLCPWVGIVDCFYEVNASHPFCTKQADGNG